MYELIIIWTDGSKNVYPYQTEEEAIKMAKADLKCMKRDISGQDEMCNSHKCDECSLNYERGNMGEQKEWLRLAIKALEQEPVIDKIRAEMFEEMLSHSGTGEEVIQAYASGLKKGLYILDKYKSESEVDLLNQTEWIPVSERLPDEGYSVLVMRITDDSYKYMRVATYQGDCWMDDTDKFNKPNPHKVIAWMPLPEPYEGGE